MYIYSDKYVQLHARGVETPSVDVAHTFVFHISHTFRVQITTCACIRFFKGSVPIPLLQPLNRHFGYLRRLQRQGTRALPGMWPTFLADAGILPHSSWFHRFWHDLLPLRRARPTWR